jgi:hypothetical protein
MLSLALKLKNSRPPAIGQSRALDRLLWLVAIGRPLWLVAIGVTQYCRLYMLDPWRYYHTPQRKNLKFLSQIIQLIMVAERGYTQIIMVAEWKALFQHFR